MLPSDASSAQARNRPMSSSTIPFQRDSNFIGREDIITNVRKRHEHIASQNHSRVALVGLGGVGKSQIAIEYAYRVRESTSQIWVFWVHASNAVRFEQAYRDIAATVDLPGRDDPKADILRLVYNWLSDESNGRWLMILDNADDDDLFPGPDTDLRTTGQASLASREKTPLATFLPQTSNGWILVTSRNLLAATNLVSIQSNIIQVEPMNEEDALALLQTRLSVGESSEFSARELVQALECIPLAITQAAAYIRAMERRHSIDIYLKMFSMREIDQAHVLMNEARDLRRDPSVRHAVIATLQMSIKQICWERPGATDLLALMSMFDREGIPEELLHDETNRLQFEDALAPLIGFSLIRAQAGQQAAKRSFEMHRLVQLSMRMWLEPEQLVKWRKESLRRVALSFPSGQYESWAACQVLLPHSKMVLSHPSNDEDKDEVLDRATIAHNTAVYLYRRGEYAAAEEIGRVGVEGREKMLGRVHPDTLASVNCLGLVLLDLGKYEEAEAVIRQGLEGNEKVLGREHPAILTSVNNLGSILHHMGKYNEAEAMYRQGLQGNEKLLGPEHPATLTSVNNLGSVLHHMGKYDEAEAMHRQGLQANEKVLGREHPDTLASASNLGLLLQSQGKYEEAEAMLRRGLERREKVLGPEHPNTLASVNNLGSLLHHMGKYEEAEAMHRRVLKGNEKVLGPEHPATLTSFNNLGSVLHHLRKYEEAEAMHRRGLEGNEKVLGPEHPETLTSVNNLGSLLESQGKYDEAEAMYRRGLEGNEKVLGREHPSTLKSVQKLGLLLERQGKNEEAHAMHRRELAECEQY